MQAAAQQTAAILEVARSEAEDLHVCLHQKQVDLSLHTYIASNETRLIWPPNHHMSDLHACPQYQLSSASGCDH